MSIKQPSLKLKAIDQLSPKQKIFLHHYIHSGFNGTQAYRALHPKVKQGTAEIGAARMLGNYRFKAALIEICDDMLGEEAVIDKVRVVEELKAIAFSNIRNVLAWDAKRIAMNPSDAIDARPIKSISLNKRGRETEQGDAIDVKVEFYDKLRALDILAKILGLYSDKNDQSGNIIYVNAPGTEEWDGREPVDDCHDEKYYN